MRDDATVALNRRARHEFTIDETFEAGLVLTGTEIKSVRAGKVNISNAYARIEKGEAWLIGAHFHDYENAGYAGHDPRRTRKLLLHKREIERIASALAEKGLALIPLRLYFKEGRAKIELALGRGKQQRDKRRDIVKREADRDMQRAMKARR